MRNREENKIFQHVFNLVQILRIVNNIRNNSITFEVEYETLVIGLDFAKVARATSVIMYCDSQVVTSQVNGDFECKGENMKKYLEQVRRRVGELQAEFVQIPMEKTRKLIALPKPPRRNTCSSPVRYFLLSNSHH